MKLYYTGIWVWVLLHQNVTSFVFSLQRGTFSPNFKNLLNNNDNISFRTAYRSTRLRLSRSSSSLSSSSTSPSDQAKALVKAARKDYVDRGSYWVYMYYLLMVYREREGNCDVPFSHQEEGWELGVWLSQQRDAKRNGKLNPERQLRLKEAGVAWDMQSQKWANMFARLQKFKEREGHCYVPQAHKEKGENLGTWLNTQRMLKKAGKLELSRQQQLEQAGVTWEAFAAKWDRMYQLLRQYQEREGRTHVPVNHIEDGENLGMWLMSQRKFKRRGKLNSERRRRLEDAGVDLGVSKDEQWEKMFQLLTEFQSREGHCNVVQSHEEKGEKLGRWIMMQRLDKRRNTLSRTRMDRLDGIGMSWNPAMEQWERMFGLLVNFKEREGHCRVPAGYVEDGLKLDQWLKNQRSAMRSGKMESAREDRLKQLGVNLQPRK